MCTKTKRSVEGDQGRGTHGRVRGTGEGVGRTRGRKEELGEIRGQRPPPLACRPPRLGPREGVVGDPARDLPRTSDSAGPGSLTVCRTRLTVGGTGEAPVCQDLSTGTGPGTLRDGPGPRPKGVGVPRHRGLQGGWWRRNRSHEGSPLRPVPGRDRRWVRRGFRDDLSDLGPSLGNRRQIDTLNPLRWLGETRSRHVTP